MNKMDILKNLTPYEKIKWTTGNDNWTMIGNERLGINKIVTADGPHGVRVYKPSTEDQMLDVETLEATTLFPSAAAMASTFNVDLVKEIGEAIGEECNMHHVDILLAPGVNLKRSPLGGRNFEYYSEDPYVTGQMAISYINGVQSTGVDACIKHVATNEQEDQRLFFNNEVDERTLH